MLSSCTALRSRNRVFGLNQPWRTRSQVCGEIAIRRATRSHRTLGEGGVLARDDELFELSPRNVVGQLLRRALHEVGRRRHDRSADAAGLGDLGRAYRVDD